MSLASFLLAEGKQVILFIPTKSGCGTLVKELTTFVKVVKEKGVWKWKESEKERKWVNAREKLIEVSEGKIHLVCYLCDTNRDHVTCKGSNPRKEGMGMGMIMIILLIIPAIDSINPFSPHIYLPT